MHVVQFLQPSFASCQKNETSQKAELISRVSKVDESNFRKLESRLRELLKVTFESLW